MTQVRPTGGVRRVLLVVGTGLLLSACATAASVAPPVPTPTPKPFDLSQWTVATTGTGPTATETASGAELAVPGDATPDPSQHLMAVNLISKCKLTGDFDVQFDYALTAWPPRNGVRLGLTAGTYSIQRTSNGAYADDRYVAAFGGSPASIATADTTGRLRLTRVGGSITGYYLHNGGWVTIASTSGSTDPLSYAIAAWAQPIDFGKNSVRVTVSHFDLAPHAASCSG